MSAADQIAAASISMREVRSFGRAGCLGALREIRLTCPVHGEWVFPPQSLQIDDWKWSHSGCARLAGAAEISPGRRHPSKSRRAVRCR